MQFTCQLLEQWQLDLAKLWTWQRLSYLGVKGELHEASWWRCPRLVLSPIVQDSQLKSTQTHESFLLRICSCHLLDYVWSSNAVAPSSMDQSTIHSLLASAVKTASRCLFPCQKLSLIKAKNNHFLPTIFLVALWYKDIMVFLAHIVT